MAAAAGGCACGAVRYEVDARATNTMVCHCRTCRRVAGAPVVAWVTFPKERFRFVRGEPAYFNSTPPVTRTFCHDCGTPLTYEHADSPRTLDVTTCTLDDAEAFPPTHHSWLSHDLGWVRFGDGLPTFQEFRNDKA
jgi:hypothetical protein